MEAPRKINRYLKWIDESVSFDATPIPPYEKVGILTISVSFKNQSDSAIEHPFFYVKKLSQNNFVLNADGGSGAKGATVSVTPSIIGPDETFTVDLQIGLSSFRRFTLRGDMYGYLTDVGAATLDVEQDAEIDLSVEDINEYIGALENELDDTIFIPLFSK